MLGGFHHRDEGTTMRPAYLQATLVVLLSCFSVTADADEASELFERRIRPVLVEHCYACHNSTDSREGDLALDFREGLRKGGEGGALIVPGQPQKSRLIAILKHEIDGLEMPQDGARFDDGVIADFERWITLGAVDPRDKPPSADSLQKSTSWQSTLARRKKWWSFQPISDPAIPSEGEWSDHPIDRFIEKAMEANGLEPGKPVQNDLLVRRLFLNLIGLPPSPSELQQWTNRFNQPNADREHVVESLVDHLLASPHFGERWARHWMDWIRYAESHGSEGDPRIENAWMYRDYLIRALNHDVSYEQLIREHLAGDLLEQPRVNRELGINESAIGPAHWRMVFHGFAPTDALDEKVRFVDDQVNAFSKAFLGMTVSCARCHNHKFDAISQEDYYALFGVFAGCRPGRTVIDIPDYGDLDERLLRIKSQLREQLAEDWTQSLDSTQLAKHPALGNAADNPDHIFALLARVQMETKQTEEFSAAWFRSLSWLSDSVAPKSGQAGKQFFKTNLANSKDYGTWYPNGQGLSVGPSIAGDFSVAPDGESVLLGIYPSGVYSHTLSSKHPARLTSPDFVVPENSHLWIRVIGGGNSSVRYVVQDYPRNGTVYPVATLKPQWNWQRFDLSYWAGDRIHVELAAAKDAPLLTKADSRSWFGATEMLVTNKDAPAPKETGVGDAMLLAVKDLEPRSTNEVAAATKQAIQKAINAWKQKRTTSPQAMLLQQCIDMGLLSNKIADHPNCQAFVDKYRKLEATIPVVRRVPGLDETRGRQQPLYVRGNHKNPGEIIPARFLEAIDGQPYAENQNRRLKLAEDLLRDDNPLTRRVIVNRLWHHLFGEGIVRTPDNLGRMGQLPTHPELLDYLATRFSADGWSLKSMIRLMVTSRAWQQASVPSDEAIASDPSNLWLSHANLRRLDAEAIRDSLLQSSGVLNRDQFGPPVGGENPRRSVYVRVIRNSLDPFLRAFDFPEPFSTTGRRDNTNVPAQSLMLMNDPRVAGFAQEFARNTLTDETLQSDGDRIRSMLTKGLGRFPSEHEIDRVLQHLELTSHSLQELQQEANRMRKAMTMHQARVDALVKPAHEKLLEQAKATSGSRSSSLPEPMGSWDFDRDLSDGTGSAHGLAKSGANIVDGALQLSSGAYVVTNPIGKTIKAKTLEAWVKLDSLNQRGGGLMSIQTPNGVIFDSIVFAEQDARQWMSGSNNFKRTQSFDGPGEDLAEKEFVHMAIVYREDGTIIGYRNGKSYGRAYKSNGPVEYRAGDAVISFGVRHLPASGGRMLACQVKKARLYDRALSPQEIQMCASESGVYVTRQQVLASLTPMQRQVIDEAQKSIAVLERELEPYKSVPRELSDLDLWTEVSKSIFMLKEFIYVR